MSNDDKSADPPWTILKTLQWTAGYFERRGIESPRTTAEILLAHILTCNRIDLYLNHDQPLHSRELARYKQLIQKRIQREPVAYITGAKEFWSLDFKVTPDVLIPRPETEGVVEAALRYYPEDDAIQVLDLGCGAGIITVALAHERPNWSFRAVDISSKAVEIARSNANRLLPGNPIRFAVANWFDAFDHRKAAFDLIVSNPPYIARDALASLEPEVRDHEPVHALDGGGDGMSSISHIIKTAPAYLKPGGALILEIGYDQGEKVLALCNANGAFDRVRIEKDFAGLDRIALMEKAKTSSPTFADDCVEQETE